MPVHSLQGIGTVLRDFPAATTVITRPASRNLSVDASSARSQRPYAAAVGAPDLDDPAPPSTIDFSHPRWPAWTAAIALHMAAVAVFIASAQWLFAPTKFETFEIALVFEPSRPPSADATKDERSDAVSPMPISPEVIPELSPPEPPPVAEAAETSSVPPAAEQVEAPPDDPVPPPPPVKPAPPPRATAQRPAPRPQQQPAGATAKVQPNAPPQVAVAIPAPIVRSTPVASLSRNRKPDYPAEARRRGLQGQALLRVEISAAGTPADVQLVTSSGYSILDQAALAAVKEWRFAPATVDGKPVSGAVEIPVRFRLDE
jgi:protein TonB